MPPLLPASAAAFAPRASVHIVLGSKAEHWLTMTLRRTAKGRFNTVLQHQSHLTKTLSSSTAIWTLASLTLPKAPDTELRDSILSTQALQLIHIEAYIIFIDMVSQNEIGFKLTPDSIKSLIEYHRDIHCVNFANTYTELEVEKLQEEFVQAIHKFVYRTHVSALEGLESDGAGELLGGKSGEVKANILSLFLPRENSPFQQPVPPELVLRSSTIEPFPIPNDWEDRAQDSVGYRSNVFGNPLLCDEDWYCANCLEDIASPIDKAYIIKTPPLDSIDETPLHSPRLANPPLPQDFDIISSADHIFSNSNFSEMNALGGCTLSRSPEEEGHDPYLETAWDKSSTHTDIAFYQQMLRANPDSYDARSHLQPSLQVNNLKTPREHPLYHNVTPKTDGLYHCPFEG